MTAATFLFDLTLVSRAQFPWVLNMEPYTVAGMARQDCSAEGSEGRGDGASGGSPRKKVTISENYELVGVVVHSGQAHAGHYYSFIKDRRYVAPHSDPYARRFDRFPHFGGAVEQPHSQH